VGRRVAGAGSVSERPGRRERETRGGSLSCGGGGCRETGATRSRKRFLPPLCSSRGGSQYRADASLDGRGRRWTVVGRGSRDSQPPLWGVGAGEGGRETARRGTPCSTVAELGARWGEPCAGLVVWWRGLPRDWGDPVLKAFPSASLRFSGR